MPKAIGIDLGTTNSEVAIIEAGQPRVLPDEAGDLMLPSCVGFDSEGKLILGREALRQYGAAPERTVRSIKRQMGTEQKTTFELPGAEAGAAGATKSYLPEELSAMILRSLKQRAEAALGEPVTQAVITVPAYFTDAQRQATKAAGEIAGLEVLQILNEPTAAALTYDLRSEETERVLVYDLGGGTFDVSIVEITGDITEVLASKGNNRLGGDDFDQRLRLHLESIFQDAHGIAVPDNALTQARLIQAAEAAKLELSEYSSATVRVPFLSKQGKKALHLDGEIERSQFETLIEPLLGETLSAIDSALEDAKLTAEDLDRIILVGGSTRIPLVRKMVQAHLGQAPLDTVEPDLCVALGAALQAGVLTGEAVESILVDVTPYSLGIAAAVSSPMGMMIPNFFSVIIPRNSVIPTSRSELYNTLMDFQPTVEVEIFQGENAIADENVPLGSFKIEGLPPKPAGEVQIEVHFDFDLNGILVVTAKEKSGGSQQSLTVNNAAVERLSSKALKQSQLEIDSLFAAASASAATLDVEAEDGEEDDWDGEEE